MIDLVALRALPEKLQGLSAHIATFTSAQHRRATQKRGGRGEAPDYE